ncbi:MscS Mechanosensitive ion channel [Cyanobium sp. PCC 7001]|uniref:mechanosensitive ion channel family protein n=1 Tax=Cyanobium sp. PCC 7001 TaxID=180281 RepID=UPI00018057ED|nr:mechanosensitive ion channel family protein [Cyanobium sp. PCC 7001]EDY39845.1 MscS Mechanosensitive ion channel [Cyanobium sp. PCC 7001]
MPQIGPIHRGNRRVRHALLALILAPLLSLLLSVLPAQAQISLGENLTGAGGRVVPDGVNRFGDIEVTPVTSPIDGRQLFKIASPTVYDRSQPPEDVVPVEQRARQIHARVELAALERGMGGDSLRVETAKLNNVTVITVRDDDHPRPMVLASVTSADANFHGVAVEELAKRWRGKLEREIRDYDLSLQPENLRRSLWRFVRILLGMVAATGVIILIKRRIARRQLVLQQRLQAMREQVEQEAPSQPSEGDADGQDALFRGRQQFVEATLDRLPLKRRLNGWGLLQWLLFWAVLLLWYGGIYLLLRQFPGLAMFSRDFAGLPLKLLLVWFCTTLAIRFCTRLLDRFEARWEARHPVVGGAADQSRRLQLRFSTIIDATKGMLVVLITLVGVLSGLGVLGVPSSSILAIGGLLGLAISFGAQNLIRDLVNGFLILAEDQFAIGDVINTSGSVGLVESLNLRVTQLRSPGGEFITIPNSTITQVNNLTRNWSRVNVSVEVDCDSDPVEALAVTRATGEQLHRDPDWAASILAPPAVLGIDAISHAGVAITTWIDTAPGRQWDVSREFRLRLLQNLRQAGIRLGTPRQTNLTP